MTTPKDLAERLRDWSECPHTDKMCKEAADLIERQASEIAALRAELAREHADRQETIADAALYLSESERLRAERDALKADADRYRWLRDCVRDTELLVYSKGADLDAAIDAAMANQKLPPTWEQDNLRPD